MNEKDMIEQDIVRALEKIDDGRILRILLERELSENYSLTQIESVIFSLLDDFKIDIVLDYFPANSGLDIPEPNWYVTILSSEKLLQLKNLSDVDLTLLRLLQRQNDTKNLGELRSADIKDALKKQGLPEDKLRSFWIEDLVDNHYDYKDGKSIEWCRIIPEDEKTEEYKKEQEAMHREWMEKEDRQMWFADVMDTLGIISGIIKQSPDWHTKDKITKQLPEWCSDYIADAFESIWDNDEFIETKQDSGGNQLYRWYPDEDE